MPGTELGLSRQSSQEGVGVPEDDAGYRKGMPQSQLPLLFRLLGCNTSWPRPVLLKLRYERCPQAWTTGPR